MTKSDVFFDTNIILYVAMSDLPKADLSSALLKAGGLVSVQVLNELVRVSRGKMKLSWPETSDFLTRVRAAVDVVPVTVETHELALQVARRYKYQIYNSMIVAAALLAGCKTLYSEDMHHKQVIDGLTIANPYHT
jgi:predicted nucleic acid-binding protein